MDISLRIMNENERLYANIQSQQLAMQCGSRGQVRCDFELLDDKFFTVRDGIKIHREEDIFETELDELITALRFDERFGGLLKNRAEMEKYCREHPESAFDGVYYKEFGFRADTKKNAYLVCCTTQKDEYAFQIYPYVSEWLDRHIQRAENGIRFIDSSYNELFKIKDGGVITVTFADGRVEPRHCRYIDEMHLEVGNELYHSCQLSEIMERNGTVYAPENGTSDTYSIYQIRDIGSVDYAFRSLDEAGKKFKRSNYKLMYSGMLGNGVSLEDLWSKHNRDNRPFGREMRSMSMSDVVVLNRDGEAKAFYADRIGFSEVPQFLESGGDTVKLPKKKAERGR